MLCVEPGYNKSLGQAYTRNELSRASLSSTSLSLVDQSGVSSRFFLCNSNVVEHYRKEEGGYFHDYLVPVFDAGAELPQRYLEVVTPASLQSMQFELLRGANPPQESANSSHTHRLSIYQIRSVVPKGCPEYDLTFVLSSIGCQPIVQEEAQVPWYSKKSTVTVKTQDPTSRAKPDEVVLALTTEEIGRDFGRRYVTGGSAYIEHLDRKKNAEGKRVFETIFEA